jgi:hypothetical protein
VKGFREAGEHLFYFWIVLAVIAILAIAHHPGAAASGAAAGLAVFRLWALAVERYRRKAAT